MLPWRAVFLILIGLTPLCAGETEGHGYHQNRAFRHHANNLDALLKVAVKGPFVVATTFNSPYRLMAANWHYALTRFGKAPNIVAATYDDASLHDCLSLGIACYNGSNLINLTMTPNDVDYSRAREDYSRICWTKVFFVNALLLREYDVLLSDIDTVWVKDAFRSLLIAADRHDADVVAMEDEQPWKPNSGNMFFRNTILARKMMAAWAAEGWQGPNGTITTHIPDQWPLHYMLGRVHDACHTLEECQALRRRNITAVWLHPLHKCPGEHMDYLKNGSQFEGICDNRIAYLHMVCIAGSGGKIYASQKIGLWFVRPDASEPHMRHARASELINVQREHVVQNMKLPCPDDLAWRGF